MRTMTSLFRNTLAIALMILAISAINISAVTFTVTNTNNAGAGSLRQAIADSNAAAGSDTVVFNSTFNSPQTITLASVISIDPAVGDSLTITGPGQNLLTVSGNNAVPIFYLLTGDTASISGMTLANAVTGAISDAGDRKSTRLNSSHSTLSRMPSSA